MTRKKRERFAELKELPNVFDREQALSDIDWVGNHFGKNRPICLELGCGRGEYTLGLARLDQNRVVIGVDKKGARLWKGARLALKEGIRNAAFLRCNIEDLVECFRQVRIEEIWIPFPDPLPKRRQAKHRLISPAFLDSYRAILKQGGRVHLKTDETSLVTYLLGLLKDYPAVVYTNLRDLYREEPVDPRLAIKTTFERRHLDEGKKIKYLCFGFAERS
jgi:tRNA (guanine-N7-)-methyltransferase